MKQKTHIFAVCAYGESPYLDECVRSLLAQTVKSEIILVTSTPNDHIRRCADKYGLRVLVNRGQGGITQDWNYAYTHSHARYVTIAHQDDFYEPDFLENALRRLEKSRKPLIFFTDYFEIRDGVRVYKNRLMFIKRLMLLPMLLPVGLYILLQRFCGMQVSNRRQNIYILLFAGVMIFVYVMRLIAGDPVLQPDFENSFAAKIPELLAKLKN